MKILVTGGAGYIGTTLLPLLLKRKYKVTVVDSLLYGGVQLLPFFKDKNFSFVEGDIRDKKLMKSLVKDKDIIIHLAAIVGYPSCEKDKFLAKTTNLDGSKIIANLVSKDQYILFGSTSSNYGAVKEGMCTEETKLNPKSFYGETKTKAELFLRENSTTTAFRFATAFGLSPRLRLDLLINEFVYLCMSQGYLVVYEPNFMRSFIHVTDMARSFLHAIDNYDVMKNEVYNIGSNKLNYTKEEVAEKTKKLTGAFVHYENYDNDVEKRNYLISYDKINATGFKTKVGLDKGLEELVRGMKIVKIHNQFTNS
jgi:nucleoside-diphosphate-sugar epimerase